MRLLAAALLALAVGLGGCAFVAPFDPSLQEQRREPGPTGPDHTVRGDADAGLRGEGGEGGEGGGGGGPDAGPWGAGPEADAGGDGQGGGAAGGGDAGGDGNAAGHGGAGGTCQAGEVRACYPGAGDEAGRGVCRSGTERCEQGAAGLGWGACEGAVTPSAEACGNGLDDDCDGSVDEDCGAAEVTWCYFCSIIDQFTDNGACAIGAVPANADGSCPDGTSTDMPECEPCRVCEVIQGFCESPDCCGDWVDSQTVGAGCQCWACPGQGVSTDVDTAVATAEAAGLAFCQYMPAEYDSACGDHMNGCWVRSCGAADACR